MESTADKRQQCMQYLATHQIDQVLKQLLVGLMVHRPKDPYQAIVDILTIARQEQAQGNPVDYKALCVRCLAEKPAAMTHEEHKSQILSIVSKVVLFRDLTPTEHLQLVEAMTERKVKAGTMVIEQGAVGDYYYVVLEGVYEVLANGQKVAEITTGGAFGEAALMTDTPRKASVRARIDGILWCVDRITFRRFVLKEQVIEQKHQEEAKPQVNETQLQEQPQAQE